MLSEIANYIWYVSADILNYGSKSNLRSKGTPKVKET